MQINEELSIKAMSISQIYSLYIAKKLVVNRQYQRKLCWTIEEKRNFIDTISNGYPVPLFLLARDEYGNYEIIDGMQRLDTICSFIEQQYKLKDGYFDLESMPDSLALKRNGILIQKAEKLDTKVCTSIANYELPVSVFSANSKNIEEVFKRINSTGKHLSWQELRQIGVRTDYATMVRKISSEMRGDVSEDKLFLNDMSKISLSNYKLPYCIQLKDTFWIKNEIFTETDLRYSRDEEVVAFLLARIILGGKELPSKALNKFYGYTRNPLDVSIPVEMTELQNGIDRIGIEILQNQFDKVLSVFIEIISEASISFRKILNLSKSISDISIYFQLVFMAIFRIVIKENRIAYDFRKVINKLNKFNDISVQKKITFEKNFNDLCNMVYGLIESEFISDVNNDPALGNGQMKCINILNRSRTEQGLYDFKISLINQNNQKFESATLDKILRTLTAINNSNPNKVGYVILGIADTEEDAQQYIKTFGGDYKLEGHFPIVGVDCDARVLKISIDNYAHKIKELIKSNKNIPEDYRGHIIANMEAPLLYGKQLLVFKTEYSDLVSFDDGYYVREFSDVRKLNIEEFQALSKSYYSNK
ncbi:MAG: DUF262 domain-containing protein [Treponema sp.]|nr:DUF262 domain-containing protein [Treponema sp.]